MAEPNTADIHSEGGTQKRRRHPLFKGLERFLAEARAVHGDTYDYSSVKYDGCQKRIYVTCRQHGPFPTTPANHLRGHGCPLHHNRKAELAVREVLNRYQVLHIEQWTHPMLRWDGLLRVDFYLLEAAVLIEFDEAHHRAPGWYGDQVRAKDQRKNDWAAANGYQMVRLTDIDTIEQDLLDAGVLHEDMLLDWPAPGAAPSTGGPSAHM